MATRTLSFVKGSHKYVFRYGPGSEGAVVDEIIRLAEDGRTNLDWLDAASLSFQVTRGAAASGAPETPPTRSPQPT